MDTIICRCGEELEEIVDTTYSNYNSNRAYEGQHTGDIYYCNNCESHVINYFLVNEVYYWDYSLWA